MTDSLVSYINDQVVYLGDAIPRNFEKWPILGHWIWPNYTVKNNYSEEINELIRWITYRANWLDMYMPGRQIDTGIDQDDSDLNVSVFPNPFTDYFYIDIPIQAQENLILHIYSATGQKILEETIQTFPFHLPFNEHASGFYYFTLSTKKGNLLHQGKLMKQE